MRIFVHLLGAEALKLRRSPALLTVWLLPLLFLALIFLIFDQRALGLHALPGDFSATYERLPLQMTGALWAGFFHPLLLATLPALLFRPEHRFKVWRHLHTMPVSRRGLFGAKALWAAVLSAVSLGLVLLGLLLERSLLGWFNPLLALPFPTLALLRVLAWLWLGSLPLLALYLWVSDRINSLAVPVVFGLIGLMLTIALSGADIPKPWKRDLIPWVLPYFCAERSLQHHTPRETVHAAGKLFQEEPDVIRLPSGRKHKVRFSIPEEIMFPPPSPTPAWLLAGFSVVAGLGLLGLGLVDCTRNRI